MYNTSVYHLTVTESVLFFGYDLGKEYVGILRLHNAIEGRDKLAQVIYQVHHHVIKIVLSKIFVRQSTKNFKCYGLFKAVNASNLLKVSFRKCYCLHSSLNKY